MSLSNKQDYDNSSKTYLIQFTLVGWFFFLEMREEGYFLIYKSITNIYNILSENTCAYYN
jgi:hypothetical protein